MSTQGGDRSNVDRSGPGTDRSDPKDAASQRVTVPSQHPEYNISVTTEQTAPGTWKAVATVTHVTDQAVQATPVPLKDEAFPDAGAAQARAVAAASEWIADNMPHA
jgi:hypothetical protein